VGNDLFLDAVDLVEASDCGGNVRSTTADAEDDGFVEE
jgi:hypothetical protein